MALGQGINDLLKYASIARAGAPQSLTGDAFIELGALFTQMDFDIPEKEEERTQDEIDRNRAKQKIKEADLSSLEAPVFTGKDKKSAARAKIPKLGKLKPRNSSAGDGEPVAQPNTMVGGLQWEVDKTTTFDPRVQDKPLTEEEALFGYLPDDAYNQGPLMDPNKVKQLGAETSARPFYGPDYNELRGKKAVNDKSVLQNLKDITAPIIGGISDFLYSASTQGRSFDDDTIAQRKSNPLKRFKEEYPGYLENLHKLRYTRSGNDDSPLFRAAHVDQSPFVRTDGFDYRQMKRATMPEYAKRLGGAAAAGYNLVIDKYNYDQKVKEDYDQELEDEMGSLNVDADFVGEESRNKYMQVSLEKKKQLNDAFNAYANGKISKLNYENIKMKLSSDVTTIATAMNDLTALRADFLEKKGTFDIDASDSEMVDFYNTLEKDPDRLTVSTIDGVDYVTGTTRGGKEIKVAASKIANGSAGFRLVEKANLAPIMSNAVAQINKFGQRTVKTAFGYGTASPTPERAREIGVATLKAELSKSENDLRSTMAQIYGINHTTYQNFLGQDQKANRNEMLQDAAEHLYDTQVKDLIFEQEKTTRFVTPKTGGNKLTAQERQLQQLSSMIEKLPPPTLANFNQYKSFIDTKWDYKIEDGKLLIGLKGKKKDEIPLDDPNFKSNFSRFVKLPAFVGQQQPANNDDPLGII